MSQQLATDLFILGIVGLFWLNRDGSERPSKALWLPVLWVGIAGSRPPSFWLGMSPPVEIAGQLPEGSPVDEVVAATLILVGTIVLIRRGRDVKTVLTSAWPIVVYFSIALVSELWSDFPLWGAKRWVRGIGDLIMVLVVVTDAQPAAALRRLFSRVGFVLLPLSVLFIKYYPMLGRGFSEWGDGVVNVGVTTNKNTLGALVYVITLGTLWQVLRLVRDPAHPRCWRRLLAQVTLLVFGVDLLLSAHSATSSSSFVLGAGLMLAFALPFFRSRPAAVHALILVILLAGGLATLLGLKNEALQAMGRNPDLTGRTEIWTQVIPMVPNVMVGAGFETFWCGPRVARFYEMHGGISMTNEAHNGYIEMYLNLGFLGLGLIALILLQGYRSAVRAFRLDPTLGALLVAYVVTAVTYSIGEAGFRILSLSWFFLLLAIAAASHVIAVGESVSHSMQNSRRPPNWDGLHPAWGESALVKDRIAIQGTFHGENS